METITLTFWDCGENHAGMQKIGQEAEKSFDLDDLNRFAKKFEKIGVECQIIDLGEYADCQTDKNAYLLIVRKGIDAILEYYSVDATSDDLFAEQKSLDWDTKAYMRGRVVNKHARHNLCFSDVSQEPDYENKKGRIIALKDVPITHFLKRMLEKLTKVKLIGEGNYYYDKSKCGIGYHGDTERRIVIGCRLGADMPLHYNWYFRSRPVGRNFHINLGHGDIYIMSEKAVGFDWKRSSIYTLRHAAGCRKYVQIKEK